MPKVSKEAIKAQEKEAKRQRALIKEQLYPLLITDSLNIEDAKQMCYATSIAIKQAFNNGMLKTTIEELGMKTKVAKGGENERFRKILEIFEKENVSVACGLLDGMQDAIGSFQREEGYKRKLDSLKADLL